MFIIYPLLALISLTITASCILFFNWVVVLFADDEGNLPKYLRYFQTHDATIPKGYMAGVKWLNRNPSYGFDTFVFGIKKREWKCHHISADESHNLFFATDSLLAFNFLYEGKYGTYKFGWKAWNNFNPIARKFDKDFGQGRVPIAITCNPLKTYKL